MKGGRTWLSSCAAALVAGQTFLVQGIATAAVSEAQVKAAYLHKIASFVRWPASAFADPAAPLRICVAGRKDIFGFVQVIARGQSASGRRIEVAQLEPAAADAGQCHILFVGQGEASARALLAQASRRPVLTVTDRSAGTRGGIIEFIMVGGTVRFAVHRGAAEARQLVLSSKLLSVAASVEP